MIIWPMRIACWIPRAKRKHSEYVIFTTFPLQKWLHERASTLRTLPVLFYPLLTRQAHVLFLDYLSTRHIFASLRPQGDVLSLNRVYLSFSSSFITAVNFVSNSGYGSMFQSCINPSFSFTLGNGTVFLHRESYFCLLCHTYFSLSLLTNMLQFFFVATTCMCAFLIEFYNKFCLGHR
jgi:hypothetical protein